MTIIEEYALQSKLDGVKLDLYPDGLLAHWLHDYNPLSVDHLRELHEKSAIPLAVIVEEGYRTETNGKNMHNMGFSWKQIRIDAANPALVMPVRSPSGDIVAHIFKPKNPRIIFSKDKPDRDIETGGKIKSEKVIKYEFPKGMEKRLHVPLASLPKVANVDAPCLITEGHKKAAAATQLAECVVMVDGVWAWRNEHGVLPDWENIAMKGRWFVLAFDSDAWSNEKVKAALNRLGDWLLSKGAAKVSRLVLPEVNGDKKTGLDDWLAFDRVHNTKEEFWRLVAQSDAMAEQKEGRASTTDEYIKVLRETLGLEFRYNLMTQGVECNKIPMTDPLAAQIRMKLRDEGYGGRYLSIFEDAMLVFAAQNAYHPLNSYLNNLKWDGVDYISQLLQYFKEAKEHEEAMIAHDVDGMGPLGLWFRKWIVGAVAKVLHPEPIRSAVLILASDGQYIGKSTFARWLCKDIEDFYIDELVQPDDKDHRLKLGCKFVWEIAELGATFRKKDREMLKAFFTKQWVDDRGAYQKYSTRQKVVCSFIGTINLEGVGFLNDPTGSTRFMIANIESIDFAYSQINPSQLWAQAVHLYRQGYDWQLSKQDRKLQADINKEYTIENPMAAEVLAYFEVNPNITDDDFVSTRDIMMALGRDPTNIALAMKLGSALKIDLGLTKGKVRNKEAEEIWRLNGGVRPQPLPGYFGLKRKQL
jgi:predicted P-loop ATPase